MRNFELDFHTKVLSAFHSLEFLKHLEVHLRRDPLVVEFENTLGGERRPFGYFRALERHGLMEVNVAGADGRNVNVKHVDPQQALNTAVRYWSAWYREGKARGYDYGPSSHSRDDYFNFKPIYLPENIVLDHVQGLFLDVPRLEKLTPAVRHYDAGKAKPDSSIFVELRSTDPETVTPYFAIDVVESERQLVLTAYNLCDAHAEGYYGPLSGLVLDGFPNRTVTIDFEPGVSLYEESADYTEAMAAINTWLANEVENTVDWFNFE